MANYDFDPVGTNPANRVLNEPKTVSSINGTNVNFFFLDAAPFFADSVTVVDATTGLALDRENDYTFGHQYMVGSSQVQKPLFGSVILKDPNRVGTYYLTYQTLGGPFVTPANLLLEDGLSTLDSLQNIKWEDIAPESLPTVFPPTPHNHPVAGLEGALEIISKLTELKLAIENQPFNIKMNDIVDLNSTFTAPLINTLSNIAAGIANLNAAKNLYTVEYNSLGEQLEILSPALGVWKDTNMKIMPTSAGTFSVVINPELKAVWTGATGNLEMRFVLNGLPMNISRSKVFTIDMLAGQTLMVQIRTTVQTASKIIYSDSVNSSSIVATRISEITPE